MGQPLETQTALISGALMDGSARIGAWQAAQGSGTFICHAFASLEWRRASRSTVNAHDQNATASSLVGAPAERRQANDG